MPGQRSDTRRGSATERGYTYKWEQARAAFLKINPLCRRCKDMGRTTAATEVDHVIPHKGDRKLFWDRANWQALCKTHHSRKTASEERGGLRRGCDAQGDARSTRTTPGIGPLRDDRRLREG